MFPIDFPREEEMKKLLALLIGICLTVPLADASAKAVKLGRGKTVSSGATGRVNGKTSMSETEKKCDSSCVTCDTKTGKCLDCPANMRLEDGKCYNICSGVTCISSNYSANVTDNGCCCEAITCPSGKRLLNGTCIDVCTGVKCATGYAAKASGNQCCCESNCGENQVYNPTIGKCVSMICPQGCSSMCATGCSACETGRYLSYSDGKCPLCSDKVSNCAACSSNGLLVTCTACADGYKLESGKCVASCPSSCSSCSSSSTCTGCNSGYYLSNGTCVACPANATCNGGTGTFTCNTGYTKSGSFCMVKTSNIKAGCNGTNKVPTVCPSGHIRTSKGCCKQGYTSETACLLCAVDELEATDDIY